MLGTMSTARQMMAREEMRQNYICDNIKVLFKELSADRKYRIIEELTRDESVTEQKLIQLCFDSVIEPCPHCGSHDMYFKVKQEYRDAVRTRWNPTYKVPYIEHYKEPFTATGTFMCGTCKAKFRANAYRVPELYKKWNMYATENRRW